MRCHSSIGAESPATLVVGSTIPSIVAIIAIILVVILLCAYIRRKLHKINNIAAGDHVEVHHTRIQTKENIGLFHLMSIPPSQMNKLQTLTKT